MENKEIQEIKVEKELPKTLEEFFIEKYEKTEQENKELKIHNDYLIEENLKLNEEILELKNEYRELIKKLKEDFDIKLRRLDKNTTYVSVDCLYSNIYADKEKYNYYKKLFNLKEEGEEDNEQRCSENNQA